MKDGTLSRDISSPSSFRFLGLSTRVWGFLSLLYLAAIFALSSMPARDLPDLAGKDHYAHFFEFAILGVLLSIWAVGRFRGKRPLWLIFLTLVCFISFYGASDEIHQYFVPGRFCELWDWVADTLGGVVSVLIILPLLWRRER